MNLCMTRHLVASVLVGFALIAASSARAQDAEAGKTVFAKCSPCHTIGENAGTKAGPALNGLDGRKAGTVPGYPYTEANKKSGIVWSAAEFKDYIHAPQAKIPKTKMYYPGLSNDTDIANLWAYLAQFKDDGTKK